MRLLALLLSVLALSNISRAQSSATPTSNDMPKLEHFSASQADKSLNPCDNFFQYACKKWNDANPIPPDQAGW